MITLLSFDADALRLALLLAFLQSQLLIVFRVDQVVIGDLLIIQIRVRYCDEPRCWCDI